MLRSAKKITVATFTTLSLFGAPMVAQAAQIQDGLVNVQVGDITVRDVNVGVAAEIAATACDLVDVGSLTVLATQVDTTNRKATVCRTESGPVRFRQN